MPQYAQETKSPGEPGLLETKGYHLISVSLLPSCSGRENDGAEDESGENDRKTDIDVNGLHGSTPYVKQPPHWTRCGAPLRNEWNMFLMSHADKVKLGNAAMQKRHDAIGLKATAFQ